MNNQTSKSSGGKKHTLKALTALRASIDDNRLSDELYISLVTSKVEARAHLRFYKRMLFISNGGVMTLGLLISGFGIRRLTSGSSTIGILFILSGALLFLKFTSVFVSMTRAIKAVEAVAKKHNVI